MFSSEVWAMFHLPYSNWPHGGDEPSSEQDTFPPSALKHIKTLLQSPLLIVRGHFWFAGEADLPCSQQTPQQWMGWIFHIPFTCPLASSDWSCISSFGGGEGVSLCIALSIATGTVSLGLRQWPQPPDRSALALIYSACVAWCPSCTLRCCLQASLFSELRCAVLFCWFTQSLFYGFSWLTLAALIINWKLYRNRQLEGILCLLCMGQCFPPMAANLSKSETLEVSIESWGQRQP